MVPGSVYTAMGGAGEQDVEKSLHLNVLIKIYTYALQWSCILNVCYPELKYIYACILKCIKYAHIHL